MESPTSLTLHLEDLEIEEIVPVELHEETKAHPENLASTIFNCTDASAVVMLS
jgi:hypothetical protein